MRGPLESRYLQVHPGATTGPDLCRYFEAHPNVFLDGTILAGTLPRRQHRLVLRWAELHRAELEESWERALRRQTLVTIEPLP